MLHETMGLIRGNFLMTHNLLLILMTGKVQLSPLLDALIDGSFGINLIINFRSDRLGTGFLGPFISS